MVMKLGVLIYKDMHESSIIEPLFAPKSCIYSKEMNHPWYYKKVALSYFLIFTKILVSSKKKKNPKVHLL